MKFPKLFAALAAFAAATCLAGAAQGAFPDKPIRFIIPFPPGGSTDTLGRMVARGMSDKLGQPVIVENLAGAGGALGVQNVARSNPEGYTLLFTVSGPITLIPLVNKAVRYKMEDLEPIGIVAHTPLLLVVPSGSPWKSLNDLVVAGKATKKDNFASPGIGSVTHVASETVNLQAGTQFQHIPYKGTPDILIAMAAGDVQWYTIAGIDGKGPVADGRLRPLATLSLERSPNFPSIPTMQEQGVAGFDISAWFGVFAPREIPAQNREVLNSAVKAVMNDPAFVNRMKEFGADVKPDDADIGKVKTFLGQERASYEKTVKALNLSQ
ncbi:hypothetical protein CAL12_20780 [Bordetella genomosp. 8]|uniref:ABC transporter substrate-binding protein n=1 Tax=Bordetella genomosp. 8 TaxID=1416806 RepID=A0A1W6YQ02_9BORD|nr:tripartite tricarboxylate transporter substrate binding protein [Bordetella genomosp. 8]ARP83009.1 hypothetical protein CAL12_20780 [Bordetella genomosp. 8]